MAVFGQCLPLFAFARSPRLSKERSDFGRRVVHRLFLFLGRRLRKCEMQGPGPALRMLTLALCAFFGEGFVSSTSFDDDGAGEALRFRFPTCELVGDSNCFANIAWMPSFRVATGSMNVDDSVPTLPTSFGTW